MFNADFMYDQYGFLRFKMNFALQKMVTQLRRFRFLYLIHSSYVQGHSGSSRIYETMRCVFYCRFMNNEVYQTVRDFQSCAQTCGSLRKHISFLNAFPAS